MNNPKLLRFCWLWLLFGAVVRAAYVRTGPLDLMKCTYGERGSLTATCVNATVSFFKSTPYRFDHLDQTLRCSQCVLPIIEPATFDISGNQIRTLDLANSGITTLREKSFVGLIFLETLLLNDNNINSIYPKTFLGIKNLKYINLENNTISILSDNGFSELFNLERLNLRHNHIEFIGENAFNGLHNLMNLDMSYNVIKTVEEHVYGNLTALKELHFDHNKITDVKFNESDKLPSLIEITFSHNYLNSIESEEFFPMNNLRRLDLSYNIISSLEVGSFQGLYTLEDLDLGHNNIAEIPQKSLQSLHSLHKLQISHNKLTTFQTGLYSGLPQLMLLNLSNNAIEEVEVTGFFSLESLHTLDLSYNNITTFEYIEVISRLPRLTYLNLEENFLPCGLETELELYFSEDNIKYSLYRNEVGSIKCVNNTSLPKIRKHYYQMDSLKKGAVSYESSNTANVWIFTLIGLNLVLVCIAYYWNFRTSQEIRSYSVKRYESQVQLISTDLESRDNNYLRE